MSRWLSRSSLSFAGRQLRSGGRAPARVGCQHPDQGRSGSARPRHHHRQRGRAAFFAPEVAYRDARKYLPGLLSKRSVHPEAGARALAVLDAFEGIVLAVARETYEVARVEAEARLEGRDLDDWPILAAAMVLDCPIWTEDKDFFGIGIPIWKSDHVEIYLKGG